MKEKKLKGKLIHKEQEPDNLIEKSDFRRVAVILTSGFSERFEDEAYSISISALRSINVRYGHLKANYFQVFTYVFPDGTEETFWVINDYSEIVTMLLPIEY